MLGAGGVIVDGTRVTGFRVVGFAGFGIVAVGTSNSTFDLQRRPPRRRVRDDQLRTAPATRTRTASRSAVARPGLTTATLQTPTPPSSTTCRKGNPFGFFLRDSANGMVKEQENLATGSCVGVPVPRHGQWRWRGHLGRRSTTSPLEALAPCPGDQEGPSVSGVGMAIVGDDDVTIRENVIDRNVASRHAAVSGGVGVMSSASFGGTTRTATWSSTT